MKSLLRQLQLYYVRIGLMEVDSRYLSLSNVQIKYKTYRNVEEKMRRDYYYFDEIESQPAHVT